VPRVFPQGNLIAGQRQVPTDTSPRVKMVLFHIWSYMWSHIGLFGAGHPPHIAKKN